MKKLSVLVKLLIALSIVTVNFGCGHVTVKDKEVCADLGYVGAECAHTYISAKRALTKAQWDAERPGYMCMRSDDFVDGEDSLDELCRITNLCDYETKAQIKKFRARMKPLVDKARVMLDQPNF